jgi:hypothetical protein
MGDGDQYRGWESWGSHGRDGGGQYIAWDDPNLGRVAQYMDMEGTWGNREDSYKEDHYLYVQRNVVDDTLYEEDF